MGLRELGDFVGIAAVLVLYLGGMQLLEWGLAADLPEPDEVDSVEVPNSADVLRGGSGVRARRARALDAERRLEVERWELELDREPVQ